MAGERLRSAISRVTLRAARTTATPGFNGGRADRPSCPAHRRAVGLFLSEPYRGGPGKARWRVVMSRRLNGPAGTFGGVVAAVMEIESFDRLYRTIDIG